MSGGKFSFSCTSFVLSFACFFLCRLINKKFIRFLLCFQAFPIVWQGLLALKNDQSSVQMHFICGNQDIARDCLRNNPDGSTSPLRIAQRMRLEQSQLEGVQRQMQLAHKHCILIALPCGRDEQDVLDQSLNLSQSFINYLVLKKAAGIVNVAHQDLDTQVSYWICFSQTKSKFTFYF